MSALRYKKVHVVYFPFLFPFHWLLVFHEIDIKQCCIFTELFGIVSANMQWRHGILPETDLEGMDR